MKNFYETSRILAVLLLLIVSCKKQDNPVEHPLMVQLNVDELRRLYEMKVNSAGGTAASIEQRKVLWQYVSSVKKLDGSNLLLVPILRSQIDKENGAQRQLVARMDSNNVVDMAIMVLIPSRAYLEERQGRVSIKDFTGHMLFYSLNNEFRKGHVVAQGSVVGELRLEDKLNQELSGDGRSVQDSGSKLLLPMVSQLKVDMPSSLLYLVTECEWKQVGYYIDSDGVFTVVAVKRCRTVSVPDPVAPFELDPLPDEGAGGGVWIPYDCSNQPYGTATWSNECNTCIGGTTGLTGCPNVLKEIKVDSTARPCVDTIATAVISKAMEIQNVLTNLLSLSNVNASAAISTMANSSTYRIKIGEHLFIDQTKYNPDGSSSLIRKNGVTNDTTGFIYLNKLMLNDGTDLAVAATLIHELMHSYMVYGIHHTTGTEREVFKTMNIFLFDQSGTPFSNQGVPQHIQMANTYVNSMASLLMSYATSRGILTSPDSSISLLEYCKDIFWQNLQHSQAYIAAPNKSRSASNGEREYKNTYNSTKKKRC